MPAYTVELTKTIVVTITAPTEADMRERIYTTEIGNNFDGAWDRAEAEVRCIIDIDPTVNDDEDEEDCSTPPGDGGALLIGGSDDEDDDIEPSAKELSGPVFNRGDAVIWQGRRAVVERVNHYETATEDWWYEIAVAESTGTELVGESDLHAD